MIIVKLNFFSRFYLLIIVSIFIVHAIMLNLECFRQLHFVSLKIFILHIFAHNFSSHYWHIRHHPTSRPLNSLVFLAFIHHLQNSSLSFSSYHTCGVCTIRLPQIPILSFFFLTFYHLNYYCSNTIPSTSPTCIIYYFIAIFYLFCFLFFPLSFLTQNIYLISNSSFAKILLILYFCLSTIQESTCIFLLYILLINVYIYTHLCT